MLNACSPLFKSSGINKNDFVIKLYRRFPLLLLYWHCQLGYCYSCFAWLNCWLFLRLKDYSPHPNKMDSNYITHHFFILNCSSCDGFNKINLHPSRKQVLPFISKFKDIKGRTAIMNKILIQSQYLLQEY